MQAASLIEGTLEFAPPNLVRWRSTEERDRMRTAQPAFTPDELIRLGRLRLLVDAGALKPIREAAHVSRGEIAKATGISLTALEKYENRQRVPHGAGALRLADFIIRLLDAPRPTVA